MWRERERLSARLGRGVAWEWGWGEVRVSARVRVSAKQGLAGEREHEAGRKAAA